MVGIRLPPQDADVSQATKQVAVVDLISDDDGSVTANSWSSNSEYCNTLDDEQCHTDATETLIAVAYRAPSKYSFDKDEPAAEAVSSLLGFQSYWDVTYADKLVNFWEHGPASEVWFGADVMEIVASWTKNLYIRISQHHLLNHVDNANNLSAGEPEKELSNWSVLDVGTGNGLLLQEFAKQGFSDRTGMDYSEGGIDLARSLADRAEFTNIKFLIDDVLDTKLDKKFKLVIDKGTLDAIGLHLDGPLKRSMCWDSIFSLVYCVFKM